MPPECVTLKYLMMLKTNKKSENLQCIVRREYCEEEFGFPQHKFLKSIGGKARHV